MTNLDFDCSNSGVGHTMLGGADVFVGHAHFDGRDIVVVGDTEQGVKDRLDAINQADFERLMAAFEGVAQRDLEMGA